MATLPADVAAPRHRLTVADLHRMGEAGILRPDDRVELIAGAIIDMSPIGSLHAALVAKMSMLFSRHVGDRAIVWTQNPVALDDVSQPQPDVAILRPRPDCYAEEIIAADVPLACGGDAATGDALAGLTLTMRALLPPTPRPAG